METSCRYSDGMDADDVIRQAAEAAVDELAEDLGLDRGHALVLARLSARYALSQLEPAEDAPRREGGLPFEVTREADGSIRLSS